MSEGVRFIELTCPRVEADRWDQHTGLKDGHERNAHAVDQPIAALLKGLKEQRSSGNHPYGIRDGIWPYSFCSGHKRT